jgi:hypothetical protein
MHEQTGAIARFETKDDAEAAGYRLPLTDQQAAELGPMNRHARRAWAVKERARETAERLKLTRG